MPERPEREATNDVTLLSVGPLAVMLGLGAVVFAMASLKEIVFAHPILTAIAALGAAAVVFFAAWRIFYPVSWHLWRLHSDDFEARSNAAEALGEIGDLRAVEPLIKALGDKNWGVRRAAAKALVKIGDSRAVEPLIKALGDNDWWVHRIAASALFNIHDPKLHSLQDYLRETVKNPGFIKPLTAEQIGLITTLLESEYPISATYSPPITHEHVQEYDYGDAGSFSVTETVIDRSGWIKIEGEDPARSEMRQAEQVDGRRPKVEGIQDAPPSTFNRPASAFASPSRSELRRTPDEERERFLSERARFRGGGDCGRARPAEKSGGGFKKRSGAAD